MKVILLERVAGTGHIGDEVVVRDGFARNYLLPQGKALRATEANRTRFENERQAIEKRNQERREAAASIAAGLNGMTIVIIRQAGETGQLYGSVSARDIVEALSAAGHEMARSQVSLTTPIKTVGMHPVSLNLHPEVSVAVNVNVARSEDEAARQARGEDLTVQTFEDEEELEEPPLEPEAALEPPAGTGEQPSV